MSQLRKLRELLRSTDADTCMQAVALAHSLGDEVVSQLLARTRVVSCPTKKLLSGPRVSTRVMSYPSSLPVVAPGTALRSEPHPLRVAVALALAAGSSCKTAQMLRSASELALCGWVERDSPTALDVSMLGAYALRSLSVYEATELRGVAALSEMPLESLRCSQVDAYDLSGVVLPALRSLVLQTFELRPLEGVRFAPVFGHELRTLHLRGNSSMVEDLDALGKLPHLETLIAVPAREVDDLAPLAGTRLRHLELSHTRVTDLAALPTSLEVLGLSAAKSLVDLSPIVRLQNLRRLDLAYTAVRDWRPLLELPNLELLRVRQTKIATILPPELEAKARAWSNQNVRGALDRA